MKDFPPIYKEKNPEVLAELIAGFVKESGGIIVDKSHAEGSEAAGSQTKKSKTDKSESSNPDCIPASAPKRKRGKGESSTTGDVETEEERAKKKQAFEEKYESQMFVMTSEMVKHADEKAKKIIADKKQQKLDYLVARDAKLKELGLDKCDEYIVQKIAEVRQIAGSVEQATVEEAKEILEQIPEASEAAPESLLPKVTQTSDLPSIIPTLLSPSNESDHDDIPLGQRMKKLPKPSQ